MEGIGRAVKRSEIYLVEFKLKVEKFHPVAKPRPKSTLWNLNGMVEVDIRKAYATSEIYLVEFKRYPVTTYNSEATYVRNLPCGI